MGKTKGSGKKRFTSINNPAKKPNHTVAKTGAVDKYFVKSSINFFVLLAASALPPDKCDIRLANRRFDKVKAAFQRS